MFKKLYACSILKIKGFDIKNVKNVFLITKTVKKYKILLNSEKAYIMLKDCMSNMHMQIFLKNYIYFVFFNSNIHRKKYDVNILTCNVWKF